MEKEYWMFVLLYEDGASLRYQNCFFGFFPSKDDLTEACKGGAYTILCMEKLTKIQYERLTGEEDKVDTDERPKADVLSMPVEKLNLPKGIRMRWMNAFFRLGIKTVGDILNTPKWEFMNEVNIGEKCFYLLHDALMEQCKIDW